MIMPIYRIKDTFHGITNEDDAPYVTNDMFDSDEDFFDWCRQHGADGQWEEIE